MMDPHAPSTTIENSADREGAPIRARRPVLDLSLTQIVGGSLAAASGAALASGLGVAGTIVGAATISVVSAVGGAVYTQSLRRTQQRVLANVTVRRSAPEPTVPARTLTTSHDPPPTTPAPPPRSPRPPLRLRALAVGAAAVFGLAIAGITGYELATGGPISGGDGGTTLGEITGPRRAAAATTPAPGSDPATPTTGSSAIPTTSGQPSEPTAPADPSGSSGSPTGTTVPPDPAGTSPPTEPAPLP